MTVPDGIRLSSGIVSHVYFDKYRINANPKVLWRLADLMQHLVPGDTSLLCSMEMGGISIATLLSHFTGLPLRQARKVRKEHGTCNIVEGGDVDGLKVCIVEDVITSGRQVVKAAKDLRDAGAIVHYCVCMVDRQQGGAANLMEAGVTLIPAFTINELQEAADGAVGN